VILHGLLGSSRNWQSVARALAPHHRVLCVDLRNHGRSPWAPTMGYAEMAADVRALIEAQRLERPVVIGHSMGGKTAMALALETPEAIGRLVVVDIAPVSYPDRFSSYVEAMQRVDMEHLTRRADATLQLATRIQDMDVVGFLMQNLVSQGSHFDWRVNLAAIGSSMPALSGFPAESLSRHYSGPTTLIRGALSDYVQPGDVEVMRAAFLDLSVVDIQGAGHWVHADRPAEFLAALGLTPPGLPRAS
jgi:pimeloyl-ACP methyl ester carboxylesterase